MLVSKDGLCFNLINSTTLELTTHLHIEYDQEDYEITKLKIRDNEVKLGDTLKFENITYEINHIRKVSNKVFLLHTDLRNKTTQYLLPILGKFTVPKKSTKNLDRAAHNEILEYCANTYLVNAYIGGDDIETLEGYMYLKLKFSTYPIYQIFEESIIELHPLFVKIVDKGDSYTYFKFTIPKEYLPDVRLILAGKYSEISMNLKKRLINFYKLNINSNLYHILHKEGDYKDRLEKELGVDLEGMELDSIPDIDKELIQL